MVFSSLTFLCLFLPLVVGLHSLVKNGTARNAILLAASLLFYAWGEPVWIVAMLFATAVNYWPWWWASSSAWRPWCTSSTRPSW